MRHIFESNISTTIILANVSLFVKKCNVCKIQPVVIGIQDQRLFYFWKIANNNTVHVFGLKVFDNKTNFLTK